MLILLTVRGQGLNNAIQDAEILVEQLVKVKQGRCGIGEAMARYEAEVVDRGGKAVRQSIKDAEDALNLPRVSHSRMVTNGFLEHQKD